MSPIRAGSASDFTRSRARVPPQAAWRGTWPRRVHRDDSGGAPGPNRVPSVDPAARRGLLDRIPGAGVPWRLGSRGAGSRTAGSAPPAGRHCRPHCESLKGRGPGLHNPSGLRCGCAPAAAPAPPPRRACTRSEGRSPLEPPRTASRGRTARRPAAPLAKAPDPSLPVGDLNPAALNLPGVGALLPPLPAPCRRRFGCGIGRFRGFHIRRHATPGSKPFGYPTCAPDTEGLEMPNALPAFAE